MTSREFRLIREASGFTQSDLAEYLGLARNYRTIQRYEGGQTRIPGPVVLLMQQLDKSNRRPALEKHK